MALTLLRALSFSLVPALLLLLGIWRFDGRRRPAATDNREPVWLVLGTFVLGVVACLFTLFVLVRIARLLDFDLTAHGQARTGAFLFLFGVVAPLAETAKVAAAWPAFRSRHFDEPFDGLVYAGAASLGYATTQSFAVLMTQAHGGMWIVRALLILPAQLFFSLLWGYGLGRARSKRDAGSLFFGLWAVSVLLHGFYIYLLAGRGETALFLTVPLIVAMGLAAAVFARDLGQRSGLPEPTQGRRARVARSFDEVRAALRKAEQGPRLRWVAFGALMMIGAMLLGFVGAVILGHLGRVDFAAFDEGELRTAAPVLLLSSGALSGLPVAGYVLAKASEPPSLYEPSIAALSAVVLALIAFGLSSSAALVWGLSCAPVAWTFACAGAWVGRVRR